MAHGFVVATLLSIQQAKQAVGLRMIGRGGKDLLTMPLGLHPLTALMGAASIGKQLFKGYVCGHNGCFDTDCSSLSAIASHAPRERVGLLCVVVPYHTTIDKIKGVMITIRSDQAILTTFLLSLLLGDKR
jgi:hypothetical protein